MRESESGGKMERELRRNQNVLVCVGTGVIMFGFWSVIKGIMTIFLQRDLLLETIETSKQSLSPEELEFFDPVFTVVCIIIGIIVAIVMLIRIYVGLSARKEGMGRETRTHRAYLVFSVILAVIPVFYLVLEFSEGVKSLGSFLDQIVPIIIDVTSLVMTIQLLVAGAKVRNLKRSLREAEEGRHE